MPEFTRADDEKHLRWLSLFDRGWSISRIAALDGSSPGSVAGMFRRIRRDLAASEVAE